MYSRNIKLFCALLLVCSSLASGLPLQQELQPQQEEETAYGSRFFDQLRAIFGKFRHMDLQRVFQEAEPIECSELIGRKGEWRPVAFFNENRQLGDWCRENLEEVKADLTVYTFRGKCSGGQGSIQVTSEFPTTESVEAFNNRRIELAQVDVMVNDPEEVVLNPSTKAYTFELPYLFLTSQQGSSRLYSFIAPNRNSTYATDVSCRWECKAVSSKDVNYRFLICRTSTVPRGGGSRNRKSEPAFGSSAFLILSDGMETHTSVKVLYDGGANPAEIPTD